VKLKIILPTIIILFVVIVAAVFITDNYASKPSFCGSCHMMKRYYDSWASGTHNKVKCVECHYSPSGGSYSFGAIFKGLGQLNTYLSTYTKSTIARKPLSVNDSSCMTKDCHPGAKLDEKKYVFGEKAQYIHKTHFDRAIEGQTIHCDSCHQHLSAGRHLEVPKEACFLCHFMNMEFNEDRAKCSLCHTIPTKPLQKQMKEVKAGEKAVTHQSLETAKVPCQSCHYEVVSGNGEIKEEECVNCHDSPEVLADADDMELLHEIHVGEQNAGCFDCHRPIRHEQIDFLDPVREACLICHPHHHDYQKQLLLGNEQQGIMNVPGLMYDVKTNCIGCHIEKRFIKGEKVLHGSAEACVDCHTERHYGMLQEWKNTIKEELEYALEIENDAVQAIKAAEDKVSMEKLNQAKGMLRKGQKNLRLVEYGGGVHNYKYSIVLLDSAMNNFEDLIDLLKE
jgi:nitrate/TMAO reductase-like tetraheme cytochrome c subunit